MKKIYNVGIIGMGVGEKHLQAYLKSTNCNVKYLCDFDSSKKKYLKYF